MGWLWLLNESGIPYRVPDTLNPENLSDIAWSAEPVNSDEDLQIRQIASCSKSAFALDSNGVVHIFLHPAVLLVRRSFEVYENQRWYPVLKWKFPLPTDWPRISTETGERASFDREALPSSGWRWEESREVQKSSECDNEGWQYSIKFGRNATWTKNPGISSFVRRRRWKRSMRYVAIAKWNPIPDSGKYFVNIAAGCSSATKSQEGCHLFAVGMDGCLYQRTITNEMPEGEEWVYIEGISGSGGNQEDIVLLSCSPNNPFLLAVTWEGKLYGRTGISSTNPTGTSWQPLQTPGGKPVTSISIGNDALWATTADNQLYYHYVDVAQALKSRNFLYFHEQSYRNVGQGWSTPAVSASDQLFLIQNGKIFNRDGISLEEKMGKAFIPIVDRTGEGQKWISIATGGFSQCKIPSHWVNDNLYFNNNQDFSYQNAKWRKEILDSLIEKNDHNWEIFQYQAADSSLTPENSEERSEKQSKVRIQFPPNKNYFEGTISLSQQKIIASTQRKHLQETFNKLLQAERSCDMCPFKYCLQLMFLKIGENSLIRVAFPSEKERDSWHEQLQSILIKEYSQSPRDSVPRACWTIGKEGNVRFHPMNELILDQKQNPTKRPMCFLRSIDLPGRFSSISAGRDGVVWCLTETGQPYSLSPSWNPSEERNLYNFEQVYTVTKTIYEYQRRQFLVGWGSFTSEVQGIAPFMGELGPVSGNYSKLPSQNWSWIEEAWLVENGEEDEGWQYCQEIKGIYKQDQHKQGYFRRRKLTRKAKYSAMTPWIPVDGPNLKTIVIQKDPGDRILIFGLTQNGEVLLRQGVEMVRPQGYVWKQIITDAPMACLALRSPTELWAVTISGKIWKRKCQDQTDMECCDWTEEPCRVQGTVSSMVIQNRCWLIVNDSLVMVEIQKIPEEDGFALLGAKLTTGSYDSHELCALETPSGLCLMPCGFLAVLEGGQVNHHPAWQKKTKKQGRKTIETYECDRVTLSTGFAQSCSFN